jgi:hypothetical protein
MKKILNTFFVLFCCIAIMIVLHKYNNLESPKKKITAVATCMTQTKKVIWLNIFVHGTFGTMLSILSLDNVLKDNVSGTTYRDTSKGMRDDHYFFQTQPILERGLISITPSFNIESTNKKILAAYPITKAFDEFIKITPLNNEKQRYYTFGWSGLISQSRRRFEAIRLFNALQEEIIALKKENVEVKVRMIAHSHGGNLCLNLGAIVPILNSKTFNEFDKYSLEEQANESIKQMFTIIKTLPAKEQASTKQGQKRFDYVPTEKKFSIDELILLGTPIQQETELFLFSPIFKKIYNVYSAEDSIQQLDWISTKNAISKQRVNETLLARMTQPSSPRIIQIKIMYERQIAKNHEGSQRIIREENTKKSSLFHSLLGTRLSSKDPGHKELWALSWAKAEYSNNSLQSFLSPLPTIVVMPLILTMLTKHPSLLDVDFNLTPTNNKIGLFVTKHNDETVLDSSTIETSFLENIKQKITSWEPQNTSAGQDFKMMYQHLTNHKQSHEKDHQKAA